jgi:predicted Holliday junction resolvase-like endonuclease
MIAIPIEIILISILWFLVAWIALAISLNFRDARKRKRLQRARQQQKAKKTVPVEQVMHLAEWKMEQWMTQREKLN